MTENINERIDELESRLAFQDDLIEGLNRMVSDQNERIRILELAYKDLRDGDEGINTGDERPPHY